jgi:sugar phosphate isomerase/epimerase
MSRNNGFAKVLALALALIFALVGNAFAADKNIKMKKYPNLKLGFTSQNFSKWLPPTVANIKTVIDFAKKNGFAFIELRDPAAGVSLADAQEIGKYAKSKKIEVIYAMGVGGLDDKYFETFSRGLANAKALGGPKIVRTGSNGNEMMSDAKKQYWTADEFAKLVQSLNKAGDTAKAAGMRFLVENAFEGVKGDGVTTFGTTELFGPKGVNANVGFQLDMANFFCVSRVENSPADVKAFFEANVKKMGYSHLKSSVAHKPLQYLDGNELPFDAYFAPLAKNGKVYVAIEVANAETLEDAYANHLKSVDYLLKNF